MKRIIKFRLPWFKIKDNSFSHFSYWGRIDQAGNQSNDCFVSPGQSSFCYYKEDQQFTGLYDKNGIELYEKDIIRDNVGRHWVIKYSKNKAMFLFHWGKDQKQHQNYSRFNREQLPLEKIGTIYENPEILNH